MVKQSIDVFQSIYKSAKLTNSILYKYSFQDTEFTVRPGDFYQKDIANNLVGSDFKLIRVILDSTSKYTTSLVFY